jgi:two-component system phosphate regulon sensor histidine kinase PhoR
MFKTIFSKLFAGFIVLTVVLSSLTLYISFRTIRQHYIATLTTGLDNIIVSLTPDAEGYLKNRSIPSLNTELSELTKKTHYRFTVVDKDGVVLVDSESVPAAMGNHKTRPEIAEALNGRLGSSIRFSSTVNDELLYVAKPLYGNGAVVGALRASIFLKDINTLLDTLKTHIVFWAGLILLLSLAGAYLFAKKLSNPIRELTSAAGKVASGDFSAKVSVISDNELGGLGKAFNAMTRDIKKNFDDAVNRQKEIEAIITSIQEALVAFGSDGIIKFANASFQKQFGAQSVIGRYYWEVIRNTEFKDIVKQVAGNGSGVKAEIEAEGRNFVCGISMIPGRDEYIAVFHDITSLKQMDKIKKELVMNVSHELRTPLTAIKGFAETIEDSTESAENKGFCKTIVKNSDRLIRIVEDLLLLSNLEDQGFKLDLSAVDLKDAARESLAIFDAAMKAKNISLKFSAENVPVVQADAFKIEQVFINLLDNAIKYTDKGSISVKIYGSGNSAVIEVEDTGPGIPKEHLPRIFERFYVVDKSRSRKLGGTGLGLAIVKHIVTLHNGEITVASEPGRGTKFTVTLPAV